MIITETHPNIETVGIAKEEHFTIGNVGRIIKILRSSMYADPIKAIAREISCNARDAHREVGTPDLPIEIHLPNAFESNYKIRDFGPGITPERMTNVFLGYGNSTKTEDNTQTGGFGLGAKTPFAYADQFTVSTITPGADGVNIKRVYIMYIGANEAGTSRLVLEAPTDEHTGTEISIDVAEKDFNKFVRATISVCNYWTTRPIITGISTFTWSHDIRERLISEPTWELCGNGDPIIVIDGIEYPLNTYSLNMDYGTDAYQAAHFGLVLRFKTGDLTLSANRESLQYDEKTINTIKDNLSAVVAALPAKITERLTGATSYREAVSLYVSVKRNISYMRDISPMWNGMKVMERLFYNCNLFKSGDTEYGWTYNIKHISNQTKRTREHLFIDGRDFLSVSNLTKIILNDTGKLHKKTIQHYIKSNADVGSVCVISSTHNNWIEVLARMEKDCEAGVNPTLLGLVFMSDLPKPPAEKRIFNKGKAIKAGCYVYDSNYYPARKQDNFWKPVEEMPDDGVFVIITGPGNKISSGGMSMTVENINQFIALADEEVYAFRDKDAGDLDKDDWTPLKEKARELIQDKLDANNITLNQIATVHCGDVSVRNGLSYSEYSIILNAIKSGKVNAESPTVEMFNHSEKAIELMNKTKKIWNLADTFGMNKNITVDSSDKNYEEIFRKNYPMFAHMGYWPSYNDDFNAEVARYINMCDKLAKIEETESEQSEIAAE